MLNENLRELRKAKGISQEELAVRLGVVRQTVSKWEKGLSVPDADILLKIAEIFEVNVSKLLGSKIDIQADGDGIAEQLSRINEQLAVKNRRSHRIWKIVGGIAIAFIVINILLIVMGLFSYDAYKIDMKTEDQSTIVSPEEEYEEQMLE